MAPMPTYPIPCGGPDCRTSALFKIAAEWSDGPTRELKTYFLCCPDCVKPLRPAAVAKRRASRLAPREALGAPGVYELSRGSADRALVRRPDLE